MIRDAIAFHDQPAQAIPERVARARELLKVLGDGARAAGSGHAEILEKEIGRLTLLPDSYFLHEYMEEDNHPVYFRDFMARAAGTGLQFLAEARVRIMSFAKPAHVGDGSLPLPADLLDREELFDFIHARTFRRTLLCHDEVRLCRDPGPHSIGEMLIGGHAQPVASANDSPSSAVEEFREMGTESTLRTENPLVKAVLHALHDVGPRAVSLATLSRAIGARGSHSLASAAASREPDPARLAEAVWACFLGSLVELYTHVPRFVVEVSERPIASPVARFQAAQGETRLASLRHRDVELTPLPRLILMHLDGTRDRSALLALLEERLAQGELTFRQPGPTPPDPIQIRLHLAEMLENSLRALAKKAFLIA
jgi:methyltransferase-like protein